MINIDLTTSNSVYNTIGPQSQWVQHRFGKRDYPSIELDTDIALKYLKGSSDTINFNSIFGDSCLHSNFSTILNEISLGKSVVNTYLNFNNDSIIEALNKHKSYVVVPIYGLDETANKILLDYNWELVKENLKGLSCNIQIEFYIYKHNVHQLNDIKLLAKDLNCYLKICRGTAIHPSGFSPIINKEGKWLYDVFSCEEDAISDTSLNQTVNGYNSLIQFVKPVTGRSILNNPMVYYLEEYHNYDNETSISVTGDIFNSFAMHQIYSNALCTDWNFSLNNIKDADNGVIKQEFRYLVSTVNKILNYLRNKNISN